MGFFIDNMYYQENKPTVGTIFQKCSNNGIDIPCFCYHESLSIAGNCRMCLVEASNSLKLVVSCAMPMAEEIKVYTNNIRVKKARESVLEFLLINHPLDCPICDQAGECDLQDITLVFGSDKSRFYEYNKRAIFDRNCGPFVKMLMTRCIHCTRCVRFLNEISGTNDFGMLGRGESSEIGTYINHSLIDELSGNIIDLCPVGALTSKPYSFKARPWELSSLESIDVLDSMASNIRVDFFNNKVYRILPIYDKNVNEDWITNKARFVYDSNNYQRINYPMLKINDKFVAITWRNLLYIYFFNIYKYIFNGIISMFGSFSDLNLINDMSKFFNLLGTEVYLSGQYNLSDFRNHYFIDKIINIFDNVRNLLFIGTNIRLELPLMNSKLRKCINNNKKIKIFYVGLSNSYNNVPVISCGNSIFDLINIFKGKNIAFSKNIFVKSIFYSLFTTNNLKYMYFRVFIKNGINNVNIIKVFFEKIFNKYFFFKINNLIDNISFLNIFENGNYRLNDRVYNNLEKRFIFFENINEHLVFNYLKISKNDFVIYHGQFFGINQEIIDLIIPSLSIYEYNGTFINLEGRIRKLIKAVSQNLISSHDFFIVLKVCYSNYLKTNLSFMKNFNKIIGFFEFLHIDWSIDKSYYANGILNNACYNNGNIKLKLLLFNRLILSSNIMNYYKSDIYTLNSKNMHLASLDYLIRLKTYI